ncbi:glycosyltransferase family 39 protein [Anaerospora sp.]|uniref:ArnT family glycosyltransferase n=1 Tax=Anaerospora sp. TaxID=1960278 RepID=UPI0028A20AEC|nr:glycosyltransferase family 39 protein [Anaerospora sp.]
MNVKTTAAAEKQVCHKWNCLSIFLLSFFIYMLFNQMVPITDPVEANYALTAKEMVLSADWLSPRIYGNVWFDKPVLFYWLTAIAFQLFGFSEWAARLMPAVFAAAGLVLIYWFVIKITYKPIAVLSVVILGTSFEYTVLAKLVITDMVFFLFNSAALIFFYFGYVKMDGKKRWYLGMYVSMALAVLTKGPAGALLPGLVILLFLILRRKWTKLREIVTPQGIILFIVVALPWYAAMYFLHGAEFINTFFGVHNYLRATVSEHPADDVSYYYLVVFVLSMLPWSALAIKALLQSCKDLRTNASPLLLFLLLWVATYFGVYSAMATKYLTYTFPILLPVAVLTAVHLEGMLARGNKKAIIYWLGGPLVLLLCVYIIIAHHYLASFVLCVAAIMLLLLLMAFLWKSKNRNTAYLFNVLCLCHMGSYILLSFFVFPVIAETRSGKSLAENIDALGIEKIGLYQFYSTSAVFYNGNIAVKLERDDVLDLHQHREMSWSSKYTMPLQGVTDFAQKSPNSLIVVPDKQKKIFLEETVSFNPQLVKYSKELNYYYIDNR